ncbi:hypothetical protein ACFL35_16475 [Candidatus Riflebacteria bacterium]
MKIIRAFFLTFFLFYPITLLQAEDIGGKDNPLVTLNYLKVAHQFNIIKMKKGKKIQLAPLAEFIVITGKYVSLDTDRMIDLTDGLKLNKKSPLVLNHLYITLPEKGKKKCELISKQQSALILRGRYRRLN